MDKCLCCKEREIEHKKRGLCNRCYHYLRLHDELSLFPVVNTRLNHAYKLKYPTLAEDFEKMKTDKSITLQQLGDKYGITRERIRQIWERYFGYHYTVIVKKHQQENKEQRFREIQLRKDPNYKVVNYKDGLKKKGAFAEKKVLDICNSLNYIVKPYVDDQSIDLIINDCLVDVKSAYKAYRSNGSSKTKNYHFHILKSQRKAEFVICYAEPLNKFFIIPSSAFPKSDYIFIPEKPIMEWISSHGAKQKRYARYWEYLEAWHLLNQPEEEIVFNRSLSALAVAI